MAGLPQWLLPSLSPLTLSSDQWRDLDVPIVNCHPHYHPFILYFLSGMHIQNTLLIWFIHCLSVLLALPECPCMRTRMSVCFLPCPIPEVQSRDGHTGIQRCFGLGWGLGGWGWGGQETLVSVLDTFSHSFILNKTTLPKNLHTALPYDLAIVLWGIYPKEMKARNQKDICTPMFTCSIVYTSQNVEAT